MVGLFWKRFQNKKLTYENLKGWKGVTKEMKLSAMTKKELILLDLEVATKKEAIETLVNALDKEGYLESKEDYLNAVLERETHGPTGLEEGLAIPHGKSKGVKKAAFAVGRLTNPILDWESTDEDNEVDLVFLIAIPEAEKGSTHIEVLTGLTSSFMKDGFIEGLQNAKTSEELLAVIDGVSEGEETTEETKEEEQDEKFIVAVTACPTGIAHTFMAAEKIKNYCKDRGWKCKVETQGSDGVKNKLTVSDINAADGIILAVDVPVQDEERFEGANYVKLGTQALLKTADETIQKAIKLEKAEVVSGGDSGTKTNPILQHIMTGISYMIPVLVLAGLLLAIGNISGEILGKENPLFTGLFSKFGATGFMTMKMMYAFFAGYLAFSIAGKPALVPGFIGGMMTDEVYKRFNYKNEQLMETFVSSGFFGALAIGFLVGYLVKYLNNKIKIKQELTTVKTMLIVPLLTGIVLTISMIFVINPLFGAVNKWLFDFFTKAGDSGKVAYNTAIAFGTAFDLGGPINKAAGAVAMGLNNPEAPEIFNLTARTLSIIIPPIGIGLAVNMDAMFKTNIYSTEERVLGSTSLLLGACGISEGAIPFLLKRPILIFANVIGAIAGSLTAVMLGSVQVLPLPAIWGWGLAKNANGGFGLFQYVAGIIVGALTVAILTLALSKVHNKRQVKKQK